MRRAYLSMRDIFFSIWLGSRTDEIDPRPIPYKITAIRQALTLCSMVSEMPLKRDGFHTDKMFDMLAHERWRTKYAYARISTKIMKCKAYGN